MDQYPELNVEHLKVLGVSVLCTHVCMVLHVMHGDCGFLCFLFTGSIIGWGWFLCCPPISGYRKPTLQQRTYMMRWCAHSPRPLNT